VTRRRRRPRLSPLTLVLLGKGQFVKVREIACAPWRGAADPEAGK
jgi:hypothetical protein